MHIYTKTKAGHQSTSTNVNKSVQLGYMCTHLTANVVSSPNQISPKLSTRETDEDKEIPEEDRARYSTSVRLFSSKQEARGRSCLFPCRCRSCFRELPLTSTPGVSSPLWLFAPTPVRHFFSSPCFTSSMSFSHADPPRLARCRCTCSGQRRRRTHPHTRAHSSGSL